MRVTGNYSYTCERMAGPGWIMVGDAFAFVDPVFSSGVYLAMHSGRQAAALVDAILRTEPRASRAADRVHAAHPARRARVLMSFIYRFNSPVMRNLFASPRNTWRVEEGVISMLAGDVFDSAPVMRRLHMFKLIYAIGGIVSLRRFVSDLIERRRQARFAFSGGNTPVDPA